MVEHGLIQLNILLKSWDLQLESLLIEIVVFIQVKVEKIVMMTQLNGILLLNIITLLEEWYVMEHQQKTKQNCQKLEKLPNYVHHIKLHHLIKELKLKS